jgi:hypothetical protein
MLKKLGLTLLIAGFSIGAALAQDPTAVPTSGTAPAFQTTVTGGDEETLRAFILRYVVGTAPGQDVNITIGELPTDLPFTLPIPSTTILYGNVARMGQGGSANYYDVAFDTTETPQAVVDFYKQAFTDPDWLLTNESVVPPSAFSGQTNAYSSFCYQQGAATLNVNAYNEGRGITNVNVVMQVPGDIYMCSPSQAPVNDPIMSLIPSLALPEGVTVQSNMGGGLSYYTPNGRSNSVGAILQSERSLTDIANDYNAQLAAVGWQQVFTENSEHTALSNWTLTDETGKTWHGSLLILADTEPNVYNALIYIEE